jgi:hypothetical protein
VGSGNWTWVDGLSGNLSTVTGLSRAHLERLLRSVRQVRAGTGIGNVALLSSVKCA